MENNENSQAKALEAALGVLTTALNGGTEALKSDDFLKADIFFRFTKDKLERIIELTSMIANLLIGKDEEGTKKLIDKHIAELDAITKAAKSIIEG